MTYSLGVDLGTTFTAAAVCEEGGRPTMVSLGSSGYAIPSVLFLREDGTFLVGEAAEMRATADPTRVARHFKRQLGDSSSRFIGGTPYSPQTLTARLLTNVLETVTSRQGTSPTSLVLTHPANWGPYRREVLEQAAAMAGVTATVQMVSEPEAAASHYAMSERIETDELLGVYDLGGGTFDAVIMRRTSDGFAVVGQPQGVERLGGVDFDDVIWAFVAEATDLDVNEMMTATDEAVLAGGHALRTNCVAAKRLLSADTSADIRIALPTVNRTVRLNRKEFENRIRPRLIETITALEAAMATGNVEAADLGRILLVGGSSRIPLVNQLLAQHFGRPIAVDSDPKNTVALGAALLGTLVDEDPAGLDTIDTEAAVPDTSAAPTRLRPPPVAAPLSPIADVDLSAIPGPPDGIDHIIDLTEPPPAQPVPRRLVGDVSIDPSLEAHGTNGSATPQVPQRPTAQRSTVQGPSKQGPSVQGPSAQGMAQTPVAPAVAEPEAEPKQPSELDALQAESRHRVSMPIGPRKENPYQPVNPNQVGDLASTGGPSPLLLGVAALLVIVVAAAVVIRVVFGG